jgi:hypothetical protein
MVFDRREFLKKVFISIGAASLPSIGFASGFLTENIEREYVIHIGGEFSGELNSVITEASSNRMILSTISPFDFSSQGVFNTKENSINAMLFGGDWAKKLNNTDTAATLIENLPFVNSNFTLQQKPNSVSNYLVFTKSKRKIGVMGIGFGENGQTLVHTIDTMNQVALYLKNDLACDEVYCLADNPTPYFKYFSLKDLALASVHINQFFGTDSLKQQRELHVIQNQDKDQVLLTIANSKAEKYSVVSVQEGRFLDFN